jgi:anti-anti-sigma factor
MSDLGRVEVEAQGSTCVVRILGEIDISNARELFDTIQISVPNGATDVAVDLSGATYLDSAAIQLLFALASRLVARRHGIRLIVPNESPIRAVLEIAGVQKVVPLEPELR